MNNDELLVAITNTFDEKIGEMENRFEKYVDQKINEQGVLLEGMRSEIKIVAEGHSILYGKLDQNSSDIKSLIEKSDLHSMELRILDKKVDHHTVQLETLDKKVDHHTVQLKH